jgi:hypothetical protein
VAGIGIGTGATTLLDAALGTVRKLPTESARLPMIPAGRVVKGWGCEVFCHVEGTRRSQSSLILIPINATCDTANEHYTDEIPLSHISFSPPLHNDIYPGPPPAPYSTFPIINMTSAEPSRRHGRYQTHYLIHTHFSRRPYYTNLPFIAADLKRWGYRVDSYPHGSLWIAEQFPKPKRIRPLLLWAREVIKQDRQQRPEEEEEQGVDADVSSVLRDFIRGLVRFGEYHRPHTEAVQGCSNVCYCIASSIPGDPDPDPTRAKSKTLPQIYHPTNTPRPSQTDCTPAKPTSATPSPPPPLPSSPSTWAF